MTGRCHSCGTTVHPVRMRDSAVVHVDGPSDLGGVVAIPVGSKWIRGRSLPLGVFLGAGEVRLSRHYCQEQRAGGAA